MGVNLSSGAISKIMSGKCTTEDELKPVLQVVYIINSKHSIDGKQWVELSDGSYRQVGVIDFDTFTSNKLQKGSVVQLTKFQLTKPFTASRSVILCLDLVVIHSKCDIIGPTKVFLDNGTPLVERFTSAIPNEDRIANSHHVDSLPDEDIDGVEEAPTSIQYPSTSTRNKKRKLRSSDSAISIIAKDISDVRKMMVKMTNDVRVLNKKVETLDEDVSKMTRMMMEKNKEDDMGACIEKLDKLGWGAEEPIYDTALLLFLKGADYRKLWLHLKPESCGKWVKTAGSIFGLLD